ncbi:MAG: SDR family NAD(P)-dependent oxidoreductase [Xanthomonadales bacterium]|nr:SDR family NAD(P)-dependent oxidoreductase [Xanthomonadales bacterium]
MTELSPPSVLVTGAASGLGEAMARLFAGQGYRVAVCDIDEARAQSVHQALESLTPGGFFQALDVRETADWDAAYQRVLTEWGQLNVLVNNAGVAAAGNCEDTTLDDWRWVIDIDLMGVVYGCHRFIPLLRETASRDSERCHVVNVSSFAGLARIPGMSAYGTAKAAVIALSEQLRAELHDAGVGVSVVCPAFVKTRLLENFRAADPAHRDRVARWMAQSNVSAEDVARQTLAAIEQGRFMVLTHPLTRRAWRLRRWFPEFYFRQVIRRSRSQPRVNHEEQAA